MADNGRNVNFGEVNGYERINRSRIPYQGIAHEAGAFPARPGGTERLVHQHDQHDRTRKQLTDGVLTTQPRDRTGCSHHGLFRVAGGAAGGSFEATPAADIGNGWRQDGKSRERTAESAA